MNKHHIPVLLTEVIGHLEPIKNAVIVDGTFGFGGHSVEIAKHLGAQGKLIGIEQDERTLKIAREKVKDIAQITLACGNFADMRNILDKLKIDKVDGILLDLGVSSHQIDSAQYGLGWQKDAPLDMRLSQDTNQNALDIIHNLSEKDLADILYKYADEYKSRRIARIIKQNISKIKSTKDLAEIIKKNVRQTGKIHPATKTFQALRIAVNSEIGNLENFLHRVPSILKTGGRLVIISFHSGEDRIVKQEFKKDIWEALTKKPVTPSPQEINQNPRSRSAKLRAGRLSNNE